MFLLYHIQRDVQPALKRSEFDKRPFGAWAEAAGCWWCGGKGGRRAGCGVHRIATRCKSEGGSTAARWQAKGVAARLASKLLTAPKPLTAAPPAGHHMTVEEMVALQTRIERQDAPRCASVSFDSHAANAFQAYISSALAFSIKRGGILYGTGVRGLAGAVGGWGGAMLLAGGSGWGQQSRRPAALRTLCRCTARHPQRPVAGHCVVLSVPQVCWRRTASHTCQPVALDGGTQQYCFPDDVQALRCDLLPAPCPHCPAHWAEEARVCSHSPVATRAKVLPNPCVLTSVRCAVDEDKRVCVQAIYEPQQEGSADSLVLERHTQDEEKADFVAARLG